MTRPKVYPTATHVTEDGDKLRFSYCCWTFCAWPEFLAALSVRWQCPMLPRQCRRCPA